MKYLERFKLFEDVDNLQKSEDNDDKKVDSFDLDFAMGKIKEEFNNDNVTEMFDDEWPNWVDSDWDNDGDYDSEYDWYIDHNNDEAEDVVVNQIITWYCKNFNGGVSLPMDPHCELFDSIKNEYDSLN